MPAGDMNKASLCGWLSAAAILVGHYPAVVAAAKPTLPTFDRVLMTVEKHFDGQTDYAPGEIISQSQVKELFEKLRASGWDVPGQQQILDLVPGDQELLVRELRTPDGRKFAQQISRYPFAYDRLDRLVRMPTGRSALVRLVKGPDGYKLLQYMTTSPGGAEMGRMLGHASSGRDFNRPTGRIYMVSQLVEELRKSYAKVAKAARNAGAAPSAP